MIHTENMTVQEIVDAGLCALVREFGVSGTHRFLTLMRAESDGLVGAGWTLLGGDTLPDLCGYVERNRDRWRTLGWLPAIDESNADGDQQGNPQ